MAIILIIWNFTFVLIFIFLPPVLNNIYHYTCNNDGKGVMSLSRNCYMVMCYCVVFIHVASV